MQISDCTASLEFLNVALCSGLNLYGQGEGMGRLMEGLKLYCNSSLYCAHFRSVIVGFMESGGMEYHVIEKYWDL